MFERVCVCVCCSLLFQQKAQCTVSHVCSNGYRIETTSHLREGAVRLRREKLEPQHNADWDLPTALNIKKPPTDGQSVDTEERRGVRKIMLSG